MSGYNLLVVDDDREHREILRQYLVVAGYRVEVAEDGPSALEAAERLRPDLALLDVQMPGMDGFEVLEHLRRRDALRDVPVLFLTSLGGRHLKVRALEAGAEDYVVKPYDRAELLARVRAGLRRAARYRDVDRVLAGDVRAVGLDTLLQTYQLSGKAARIRLLEMAAVLDVRDGAVACAWGEFRGAQALARLLLMARGAFVVEAAGVPETLAGAEPIATVMMNAAVGVDEMRKVVVEIGLDEDAWLDIGERPCADEAIEGRRGGFPMRLFELVASLPGRLADNANAVWGALAAGEIVSRPLHG